MQHVRITAASVADFHSDTAMAATRTSWHCKGSSAGAARTALAGCGRRGRSRWRAGRRRRCCSAGTRLLPSTRRWTFGDPSVDAVFSSCLLLYLIIPSILSSSLLLCSSAPLLAFPLVSIPHFFILSSHPLVYSSAHLFPSAFAFGHRIYSHRHLLPPRHYHVFGAPADCCSLLAVTQGV